MRGFVWDSAGNRLLKDKLSLFSCIKPISVPSRLSVVGSTCQAAAQPSVSVSIFCLCCTIEHVESVAEPVGERERERGQTNWLAVTLNESGHRRRSEENKQMAEVTRTRWYVNDKQPLCYRNNYCYSTYCHLLVWRVITTGCWEGIWWNRCCHLGVSKQSMQNAILYRKWIWVPTWS